MTALPFRCLHSGGCCEKIYTQISITVGDVVRIAAYLGCPVEGLFTEGTIGLKPFESDEGQFQCELGLTIPCKFRANKRCAIYEARPINCRLFPYWLLAELTPEQIKHNVDPSYKCVHNTSFDLATKRKYMHYTKGLVRILEMESALTDTLLQQCDLKRDITITRLPGFDVLSKKIRQLSKIHSGVELAKRGDELRIPFVIEAIRRDKTGDYTSLIKRIPRLASSRQITSLEKLNQMERIIC